MHRNHELDAGNAVLRLSVLSPLVLAADLFLFFGGKVVGDVKCLANLLWGLALDHVGDGFAANIKKGLNIQIVGGLEKMS